MVGRFLDAAVGGVVGPRAGLRSTLERALVYGHAVLGPAFPGAMLVTAQKATCLQQTAGLPIPDAVPVQHARVVVELGAQCAVPEVVSPQPGALARDVVSGDGAAVGVSFLPESGLPGFLIEQIHGMLAIWMRLPQVSSNTAVVTGPMDMGGWVKRTPSATSRSYSARTSFTPQPVSGMPSSTSAALNTFAAGCSSGSSSSSTPFCASGPTTVSQRNSPVGTSLFFTNPSVPV